MFNNSLRAIVLGVVVIATPAFAGTEFLTYEGRDAIHEGTGGEKKIVEGVEFWMSGSPPHRFQVLGSIVDERHKSGLIGLVVMSGLEKDIANVARRAGGDAVILVDEHDDVTGMVGSSFGNFAGTASGTRVGNSAFGSFNGFGSTTAFARPIKSHSSHYVVVRYLPDAVTTPVSPTSVPTPPTGAPVN